ncbi:hypothetical protein ASPBRDRAFT_514078 [Aspergillus brasiliensis CBS 101740]|uniref:Uncharacterized protein n=1 Tax=Aspergillus brasiliensis (strain CBS 101740 / IMI 381727 / IBT 21946) TaxID=767769 RepID=A0A1L9UPS9_ASPBC|nr:hypothetical protein ASPBRDRAFT_514078 [Aspergillus brasiliensis CBS 101740]
MDINEGCDSLEQGAEPNAIPFLHSEPAPLDDVTKSHLLTRFQPRRSKYSSVSHDACIECHVDLFGRAGVGKIIGGMNAYDGDFTALCAPEALPERIAFCSYFNEYAFVYDDTTVDAVQPTNPILEDAILTRALGIKKAKELTRPGDTQTKKQLLAKIWALLQEIDPDYLGRCHAKFIEWYETAKLMRDKHFTNLDAYLLNRALDCGAKLVNPS